MESTDTERRQSDTLPSLNYIRYERSHQDVGQDSYSQHRQSQPPSSVVTPTSPTTKYASPLPNHSSLQKPLPSDYISPPESRRTSEKEDEDRTAANPTRSVNLPSLPSLNQMIDTMPSNYMPSSIVSTGAAPVGPPSSSALNASSIPRPYPSRPLHEDHPSASQSSLPAPPSLSTGSHHSSPTNNSHGLPIQDKISSLTPQHHSFESSSSFNHTEGPGRPAYGFADRQTAKDSPRSQSRNIEYQFGRPPPPPHYTLGLEHPSNYEHRSSYGQISPHISSFPPPSSHPPTPASSYSTTAGSNSSQPFPGQAAAFYAYQQRGPPYGDTTGHSDPSYSPKGKSTIGKPSFQDTYGSAINRALDISELRRELDLIRDNASHLYHFSTQYTPQGAQQGGFQSLKYSGQVEPSLQALDDAIGITHRILEALDYWKSKVVNDQNRKQDQQANASKPPIKRPLDYGDDDGVYGDELKGSLLAEHKKQRKGKAAPPGRCHSCNRAETPEWRRGPDGARTLCNACGLHYAKLTRKLNKNNSAMGTSPLARKPTSAALM